MSRSNIDRTLDCVTSSKETQDKKQTDSEEAEAEPAKPGNEVEASTVRIEPDSAEFRSTNSNLWEPERATLFASSKAGNGAGASQIEAEASEPEMTWEEVEDEWFEFGSDFMIF